jgi:hypothetical protein
MGLDVGVVNITYLDRPEEPMYDFLWALAEGSLGEDWGGGWEGNALVEYQKENLIRKANDWAESKGLGQQELTQLLQWVEQLPWSGDDIMLHLNW